ncbi:MAG: hypothetical protein GX987_03145 [Tissierellia bacterium]|nr:hypothetical protein [Tissierellia bacterium]
MIRYKQLVTLKVVDKETEEPIGKILDVIYSDDYKKIAYLVIKNNNLIKNKFPISYEDIGFLNDDQVLYLKSGKVLQNGLEVNIKEEFNYIDKEIRLENEECIGYVKDVLINKENGFIEGFIITEGIFEDLLKGRNYMPFLENTIIKEERIYIPDNKFN